MVRWRRLVIAAPMLSIAGIALWWLAPGGASSTTPRAALADTPHASDATVGVTRGHVARDFVATAPDGATVRLSDLRGGPTIINFWATWCSSCLAEMPDLKAVQAEAGDGQLNVIAVNTGEDTAQAQKFLRTLHAPAFRVAMDPTLVVADAYGVFGLSQSIFVDKDGVIRATYSGQLSKELMRRYVAATAAGADGGDAPKSLRLLGSVEARRHVLEVRAAGAGAAEFRSKSLRCDDSYCAASTVDALAALPGIGSIDRYLAEDPARIVVRYDSGATSLDEVAQALAERMRAHADPLYEQPLEIERK